MGLAQLAPVAFETSSHLLMPQFAIPSFTSNSLLCSEFLSFPIIMEQQGTSHLSGQLEAYGLALYLSQPDCCIIPDTLPNPQETVSQDAAGPFNFKPTVLAKAPEPKSVCPLCASARQHGLF